MAEPSEVTATVETLTGFSSFIKTLSKVDLVFLIHDLRKHPEDVGHLKLVQAELKRREEHSADLA